jgi:hypothetical protein
MNKSVQLKNINATAIRTFYYNHKSQIKLRKSKIDIIPNSKNLSFRLGCISITTEKISTKIWITPSSISAYYIIHIL